MGYIADIHVHSRYSRATSKEMRPEGLWRWAQIKGIGVIGTGDFTHPEYFGELSEMLEPGPDGLFVLKQQCVSAVPPASCVADVHFILQAEISSIYSKNGRTRKVHSIVLAPGFREAAELNRRLDRIGNIKSDGRPILGLDAKKLLEICLDVSPMMEVIPAHAWTPHFSVFGAMSGFDSLEECYGDMTPHIHAIETGLSSDPPMNRRLSALDGITLISNSDAHSPAKLGREANLLSTGRTYSEIINALRTGDGFEGTIEFFPEEGKYHMDGHRKCSVCLKPVETRAHGGICPVCGRKLTVGVMHRVDLLADREEPAPSEFRSIVPMQEIVAQVMGRGVNTKGVVARYFDLIKRLGNEFHILLDAPLDDIGMVDAEVAQAIGRMRGGEVTLLPGYDGEFGVVSVAGEPPERKKPPVKGVAGDKKSPGMLF